MVHEHLKLIGFKTHKRNSVDTISTHVKIQIPYLLGIAVFYGLGTQGQESLFLDRVIVDESSLCCP
jgi:hypothetical protein